MKTQDALRKGNRLFDQGETLKQVFEKLGDAATPCVRSELTRRHNILLASARRKEARRQITEKGSVDRRIIYKQDRVRYLHATKGWRAGRLLAQS